MKIKHITQERVKELFAYNPNTGILTNRVDRGKAKEGEIAGWVGIRGYLQIGVDGTEYPVHQLIFIYHHGYLPENLIGHRDRDKLNNRIENLVEVTKTCVVRNRGNLSTNTSGVKGVFYQKNCHKWLAYLAVNGKRYGLGMYPDFDKAVLARFSAEQKHNASGCFNNSPAEQYLEIVTTT